MAVYIDPVFSYGGSATFRWKDSCHLYADTLEELHVFAIQKLFMHRAWFQDKRLPHYDLTKTKAKLALARGAVQHTRREAWTFWNKMGWVPALDTNKETIK